MKTPKTLIVCKSTHHGNTLKVAQAMADVFDARILRPEEVDPAGLGDFDLIGLGSGIYFGRAHPAIRQLVLALARPGNAPKFVFLFSTTGIPFLSWLWHRPLKRQLERAGSAIVGEFSCRGWDTVCPAECSKPMTIKVLALDLERTLIDNAMSGTPRSGLAQFLAFCPRRFERRE